MARSDKVQPNDPCPCWTGKKYKHCCKGTIDWTAILRSGVGHIPHMSIRGRNLLFCAAINDALGFDVTSASISLKDYKKAFTASAVRKIYEAIYEIWPTSTDVGQLLARARSDVSGLYIGDYNPSYLKRAVVRHSTYANKILLVDPFMHPYGVSDKYNPIHEPAQYRAQTLKNVNLYRALMPWVDAGIVEFIRTPADFDRDLNWNSMLRANEFKGDPSIQGALKDSADDMMRRHENTSAFGLTVLGLPDEHLLRKFRTSDLHKKGLTEEGFLAYINAQRDRDPDFLEPMGSENNAQLHMMFSGGTYEVAKLTSQMSGSYLFTDLKVRWAMIERDRAAHSAPSKVWSPFAKSVQDASLHYLNNLNLDFALRLRKEGRLEGVRSVMTEAWRRAKSDDPYDEATALYFAENLTESVREAEAEWDAIKADILKFTGPGVVGGVAAMGAVTSGQAVWLAAAAAVGGAGAFAWHKLKEAAYLKRHPAAFFMDVRDEPD